MTNPFSRWQNTGIQNPYAGVSAGIQQPARSPLNRRIGSGWANTSVEAPDKFYAGPTERLSAKASPTISAVQDATAAVNAATGTVTPPINYGVYGGEDVTASGLQSPGQVAAPQKGGEAQATPTHQGLAPPTLSIVEIADIPGYTQRQNALLMALPNADQWIEKAKQASDPQAFMRAIGTEFFQYIPNWGAGGPAGGFTPYRDTGSLAAANAVLGLESAASPLDAQILNNPNILGGPPGNVNPSAVWPTWAQNLFGYTWGLTGQSVSTQHGLDPTYNWMPATSSSELLSPRDPNQPAFLGINVPGNFT